ncbi:hypothetical protein [Methylobacterium thuringiense]|uniref:hypothetical protein n=1 Tax=Methylobacterium thuringiense TaxID=1003091 RepID=UPI001EDCC700|nr:hypothetical protein [Methylobacterium thuringiense]
MKTSNKPAPPPASDKKEEEPVGGLTAPVVLNDKNHEGPKTGGYDDHSLDQTSSNEKGGYGTG